LKKLLKPLPLTDWVVSIMSIILSIEQTALRIVLRRETKNGCDCLLYDVVIARNGRADSILVLNDSREYVHASLSIIVP
jgi:hypothetical protein